MKRDLTAHPELSPEWWGRVSHGQHHAVETIVQEWERQPQEGCFMVVVGRCPRSGALFPSASPPQALQSA